MLSTVTSRQISVIFARVARSGARLRVARKRAKGAIWKALNILVITAMILPGPGARRRMANGPARRMTRRGLKCACRTQ